MSMKGSAFPRPAIPHLGSEDLGGFSLNWRKRGLKIVCNRRCKDRFTCGMRSEMVDHKHSKLSKRRLLKDLNSLPKPWTMADLSSIPKNGSKVHIAFKGIPGAYSEDAALKAYPQYETVPCKEFKDAFEAAKLWLSDKAVLLPVENSFGGSIHRNYDHKPFQPFIKRNLHIFKPFPSCSILTPTSQFRSGFLHNRVEYPPRRSSDFRLWALPGLDFAGFESAQSVVEAVSVLTAIVVVHESGHFLAAYLQGIHVSKFAVGFGPILAKFNSNNVEYSLRAFPLGGFVGFPDNDPESDIPVDDVNLLKNRPVIDRVIVVSAGVIANIVFAYAIIFTQVLSVGLPVQEAFPGVLVPEVRPFSAASRDGLLPGDVIISVNGVELAKTGPDSVSEIVDVVKKSASRKVLLKIERGNQNFELGVTPDKNSDGSGRIGVQLSPNVKFSNAKPSNLSQAFAFTGKEFWGLTSNVLDSLKQTFLNFSQTAEKVSGPVAIIAVGAEVARSNINGLYQFAAVLNINLAVINLLPLPALDGGTLALILVEAARGGRKLPLEVEQRIMSSGIMLILVLGVYLLIRDTLNLDFIKDLL